MRIISKWLVSYLVLSLPMILIFLSGGSIFYDLSPVVKTFLVFYYIIGYNMAMIFLAMANNGLNEDSKNRKLVSSVSILSGVSWASTLLYALFTGESV